MPLEFWKKRERLPVKSLSFDEIKKEGLERAQETQRAIKGVSDIAVANDLVLKSATNFAVSMAHKYGVPANTGVAWAPVHEIQSHFSSGRHKSGSSRIGLILDTDALIPERNTLGTLAADIPPGKKQPKEVKVWLLHSLPPAAGADHEPSSVNEADTLGFPVNYYDERVRDAFIDLVYQTKVAGTSVPYTENSTETLRPRDGTDKKRYGSIAKPFGDPYDPNFPRRRKNTV